MPFHLEFDPSLLLNTKLEFLSVIQLSQMSCPSTCTSPVEHSVLWVRIPPKTARFFLHEIADCSVCACIFVIAHKAAQLELTDVCIRISLPCCVQCMYVCSIVAE